MKKLICLISLLLVTCIIVSCASNTDKEADSEIDTAMLSALAYFVSYEEATKENAAEATKAYRHFEDENTRTLCIQHASATLEYEVIRVERKSQDLFEIEFFAKTEAIRLGFYAVNFVGTIDGRWWVMSDISQIPDDLKEGLELEEYDSNGPGILDVEP